MKDGEDFGETKKDGCIEKGFCLVVLLNKVWLLFKIQVFFYAQKIYN